MLQVDWNDIANNGDQEIGGEVTKDLDQLPAADPEYLTEPHLACCLLVDVSDSMNRDGKINQLNQALANFRDQVCADSLSAKRVEVCVISFGTDVKIETPFVPVSQFNAPTLTASGVTAMGKGIRYALETVHQQVHLYHDMGIECFKPFVLMITDGLPTDLRNADDVRGLRDLIDSRENAGRFGHLRFHAFAVKPGDTEFLYSLTDRVMAVLNNDFSSLFNWASKTMQTISHSRISDKLGYAPTENNMMVPKKGEPVNWDS